jgi:high-affinity Fe2+/Pb2+ permease
MADKDTQLGIIVLAFSVFFFMSATGMMRFEVFENGFSMFLAFILVAVGVYLITKK